MSKLTQGNSIDIALAAGEQVVCSVLAGHYARVQLLAGAPGSPGDEYALRDATLARTFGPYGVPAVLRLRAIHGAASYAVSNPLQQSIAGVNVSPAAHIGRILAGAAAARRVRPDATYSTARWCTPAGAGLKDGTSLANAWGHAELNTALATLASAHVYMIGVFEPAAYNSAGPIIGPVIGDNVRLDLATYGATVRGYSGASWTASGTNGEYWTTASNQQPSFRLTEDGLRMRGVSGADCGAQMDITAIDTGADTVTVECYRALVVGDSLTFIAGTANGLTAGTLYYVKTATAPAGSPVTQTLTLSATPGGATIDITGTLSGSRRFWALVDGRDGDPVPGSLQPGEYAWAPHESRVYMRPSSGTPADHVYTWWQTGASPHGITAGSAAVTDGLQIIGGEIYGVPTHCIFLGDTSAQGYVANARVHGVTAHSAECGIVSSGATNSDCQWNRAYDCTDHAIGSKNGNNHEAGLKLHYNWAHDIARQPWDSGDCQALVTNPSSDDAWINGNVVQRIGQRRDFARHPLGLNDTVNTGTIVVDSSQRVVVTGNYLEDCYGELVEIGPNDVQAVAQLVVSGNVFDQRGNVPMDQDSALLGTVNKGVYVGVTSSASAGFGSDFSNVVEGNLFLVGDLRRMATAPFKSGAMASIRNAKAGGSVAAKLYSRNNVVLCLDPGAAWDIVAIAYTDASSGLVTGIDSDWNTYYAASGAVRGAAVYSSTAAGEGSLVQALPVAELGNGAGWTGPDGTISDKNSTVWTTAQLEAEFGANPTVLRCLSVT